MKSTDGREDFRIEGLSLRFCGTWWPRFHGNLSSGEMWMWGVFFLRKSSCTMSINL